MMMSDSARETYRSINFPFSYPYEPIGRCLGLEVIFWGCALKLAPVIKKSHFSDGMLILGMFKSR